MSLSQPLKVGVVGITGYGGAELARILLSHPHFELVYGSSGKDAGKSLGDIHPNLRGMSPLVLSSHPTPEDASDLSGLDAVFLAMPHGKSMALMPHIPESVKVVDLAGDYRLNDLEIFETFYKQKHSDFERSSRFAYGLTEVYRSKIKSSSYVANPGCFATVVQLSTFPFVKAGVVQGKVIVDAKTGSSGSGATASATTHHPFRDSSFYAYKLLAHQHLPEIKQTLGEYGFKDDFIFQVHSAPMVRGIFASCYMELNQDLDASEVEAILKSTYEDSPFVRVVQGSPNVHWVKQSNFADIGFALQGRHLAVFGAIDNLVKGAAGQAVQNMNLMWGLDEKTGIHFSGGFPG